MAFRKISEKVIEVQEDGKGILFFEGYCDADEVENLPTEGTCQGSNVIASDGWWYFFNEATQTWDPMLCIME